MPSHTKVPLGQQFNADLLFKVITSAIIIGLIGYMIFYWFGGLREADNLKDASYQWTQNAIVLDKTHHWWGDSCLLKADDGKRYYDDSCSKYVNDDKVTILMYKEHYRWIEGIMP